MSMLKASALEIQRLITAKCGREKWPAIRKAAFEALGAAEDESFFVSLGDVFDFACEASKAGAEVLGQDETEIMEECGAQFLRVCVAYHGKVLYTLGGSLFDFLNNFNDFVERFSPKLPAHCSDHPAFHCAALKDGFYRLEVQNKTSTQGWEHFVTGLIKTAAAVLFSTTLVVTPLSKQANADVYIREDGPAVFNILELESPSNVTSSQSDPVAVKLNLCDCLRLCCFAQGRKVAPDNSQKNTRHPLLNGKASKSLRQRKTGWSGGDLCVEINALCNAFPFHVLFSANLQIQQLGATLGRLIGPTLSKHGRSLDTYFELVRPSVKLSFKSILSRMNCSFCLRLKASYTKQTTSEATDEQTIELKGQMILLAESGCVLYLGSVVLRRLEELRERALFLSDIPIHDGARDLILVSEQALAQNALHKRMQQLKRDLDRASVELAKEKKHTEELLESIFPHEVARRLVHRQPVPAEYVEDVSILFSDIVGFTTMAAKAPPMEVVEILNSLYTMFDKLCEELDLYKVETIGDAYVVAGGIHNSNGRAEDARKVALMGLGMIDATKVIKTPDGNAVQMRIGIHTGEVLSGVVGTKMPRYCLFGNNVTLANKMEAESEGGKVNVSPRTYAFINKFDDFSFSPRDKRAAGFANSVPGTCYFLGRKRTGIQS